MDLTWSLEELARTSDDTVARRRFDQRNLFFLLLLLFFFGFVAFMELAAEHRRNNEVDLFVASGNFILVIAMLMLVRDTYRLKKKAGARGTWGPGRWIHNHVSATVLWYVPVQYALLLAFGRDGEGWVVWSILMPLFMLGFRMLMAELVLLHGMLVVGSLAMSFFGRQPKQMLQMYIGVLVVNVLSLGVELIASHRLRKTTVAEWSERRTQAREQIRMRDELAYARELQMSMLPECAPDLPWADLCATSIPATEVGGDYYDYFVDGDRVALVCGDVAGHGMASGLVLSALRSGFTLLRDSLVDPAAVLRRLHDLVAETSRRRMLVTVAVVLLDQKNRRATIASAGHPPVVIARANGSVETIDLYAPPLGVRLPVVIPQRTVDVEPGDVFVLHSDGIYETRNDRDETYGLDRLARIVQENAGTTAEEIRDAIISDVDQFRGSSTPEDDVTVVVAKI